MLERLPEAVGAALSDLRAGLDKTLYIAAGLRAGMGALTLGSLAFVDHAPLPVKYSADGDGLSPPLQWSGVPPGTTEVVLIVEDADSPTPLPLVHAIVVALPGADGALAEGGMGGGAQAPLVSMGRNSLLRTVWLPPDPPPGHGVHRYVFQVFALGAGTPCGEAPGRDELREQIAQRALASGCLVGTYERPDTRITEGFGPAVAAI